MCEIVHNGSLVIDDIEDDSKMRRGKPCIHLLYNLDVAVNAGCFMYFAPLYVLKKLRKEAKFSEVVINRAYELYCEEMIKIHLGQGLDIWWHSGKKNPSVNEYLQMCAYKTGTLARLSAKITAMFCNASEDLVEKMGSFAESLGVAFQIQDDMLNLIGEEFAQKIAIVGEDIFEGKRSLMAVHSIINAPPEESNRLIEILNMKTRDPNLINEAINIMKKNNSFEYSSNIAKNLVSEAWDQIEPLLPNNEYKDALKHFSHYLINRKL
jgi:geranylgeranyl pyrophosphate synthase